MTVAVLVVQSSAQEDRIQELSAELEELKVKSEATDHAEGWPVSVQTSERGTIVFRDPESLAYYTVRGDADHDGFMYALERDIHRNPALMYWLAETHAAVDQENDPLPYLDHRGIMERQAARWDGEPYLAFPYQVNYPGGQD
jgi:hypothetical protein